MLLTAVTGQPASDEAVELLLNQAADDRARADILNAEAKKKRSVQPTFALQLSQRAMDYARRSDYRVGLAEAMTNAGVARNNLSQFEEALNETKEALEIYSTLGDKSGESSVCLILSGILFRLGRYDRSLEYLNTALTINEEQNNKRGISTVLSNISNTYQIIGQFDIALENLLKALEIQEEIEDRNGIAITANNIGGIYFKLGHPETALQYLLQSLSWFREVPNLYATSQTLCNIGDIHGQLKHFDKALSCLSEALAIAKTLNDQRSVAATITSMGRIYVEQGETATALSYFATSLKILRDIGDKHTQLQTLRHIGDIYHSKKEFKRALRYYKDGIELARTIGAMSDEATLYECASLSLEALKEYETSLSFYRKASSIRNEVLASDKQKLVAVMEIRFNIERTARDREIYRLRNVELADAIKALQEKSDALASAYHDIEQQQQITAQMNTELEKANVLLRELNQEKNELLGIVTHDVKNLVAGIKLAAEGVRRYKVTKDDPIMQKTAERIINAATDITHLISSLLDVNAIETGKITFRAERVDVVSITQSIIEHYKPQMEIKNLSLNYMHEEAYALADPDRLKEAIDNIISNAVKYSPHGKDIRILVARRDTVVRCIVADSGQGFTENDKKFVFQKFTRLSARPTGGESSTGLGLSIAKKLVEMMNGSIWLESEHGKGATFFIEVPAA